MATGKPMADARMTASSADDASAHGAMGNP